MTDPSQETAPYLPGLELVAPFIDHTDDGKSNTIELYDALALTSAEHAREGQRFLEATKIFRGRTYQVRMSPAVIKRPDGKPAMILPGLREDLVEKALRKIASNDLGSVKVTEKDGNAEVWVKFTQYQLRQTLAEQGHHFTIAQLSEAIDVMQGCTHETTGEAGDDIAGIKSGILQTVVWRRKKKGDPEGVDYRICAKFHPFITRSILARTFRRIDFGRLMRPKNQLARWLYVRLSHNYTQAQDDDLIRYQQGDKHAGYHLSLSTIIRETATRYSDLRMALRAVRTALAVLRKEDVLCSKDWKGQDFPGWLEEISYGSSKGGRRPIKDVVFYLFASEAVVTDIVEANKIGRKLTSRR